MSSEAERLSALEEKVKGLDATISKIEITQKEHGSKIETISGCNISINSKLDILIEKNEDHLTWHKEQTQKGFDWGQLAIGIIMAVFTMVEIISNTKQPEVRYVKANSEYTQDVENKGVNP